MTTRYIRTTTLWLAALLLFVVTFFVAPWLLL